MQPQRSEFDPSQLPPRIASKIAPDPETGCWVWTGGRNAGYGSININNQQRLVHRTVYELLVEPIPAGLHVLHRCDNPPCANPAHLFTGTHSDNMRDMMAKGRGGHHRRAHTRGEANGHAKLTDAAVRDIRARYIPRVVTYAALAEEYGVCASAVVHVVKGRTWRHNRLS